jgi:hypothetical protein
MQSERIGIRISTNKTFFIVTIAYLAGFSTLGVVDLW